MYLSENLQHVRKKDVKRILKSLKKDKSPGPDGIPPILLNELAEEISYPLTKIF